MNHRVGTRARLEKWYFDCLRLKRKHEEVERAEKFAITRDAKVCVQPPPPGHVQPRVVLSYYSVMNHAQSLDSIENT